MLEGVTRRERRKGGGRFGYYFIHKPGLNLELNIRWGESEEVNRKKQSKDEERGQSATSTRVDV